MGLDMYLHRNTSEEAIEEGYSKLFDTPDKYDDWERYEQLCKDLTGKVAYWRKANQIHQWFVDNVQKGEDDCGRYVVSFGQIVELKNLCIKVLENPELAPELLPTQEGFFFGGTEYDEYYFKDLKDTVQMLEEAIEAQEADPLGYQKSFFYSSSW